MHTQSLKLLSYGLSNSVTLFLVWVGFFVNTTDPKMDDFGLFQVSQSYWT